MSYAKTWPPGLGNSDVARHVRSRFADSGFECARGRSRCMATAAIAGGASDRCVSWQSRCAARVGQLGVMLVFASVCCSRNAAAVTVDFDALASGDTLADQYLADGAQFFGLFFVANATFGGALTVPSPPNWVAVSDGTQTLRFVDPTNAGRLASTDSVAVDTPALSNGCFDAIQMKAYDVQHNLIDTATTPAFTSSGSKTTTTVSGAGIHYVRMTRIVSGCSAPFDNLVFADVVLSDTIFFDDFDDFQ